MRLLLFISLLFVFCNASLLNKLLRCSAPTHRPGPTCMAYIVRYTYDKDRGCVKFIYGGCRPSLNNFETYEECRATCGAGRREKKLKKAIKNLISD